MLLTRAHLETFAGLSSDHNPLHRDDHYARKTEFGQVVVYGLGTVLFALGKWARGRAFTLLNLRAQFKKPIFLDTAYEVVIQEKDHEVSIRILRGPVLHTKISFAWKPGDSHVAALPAWASEARSAPLTKPHALPSLPASGHLSYAVDLNFASRLRDLFGLDATQIPSPQLNALAGISYLVGMWTPGQQALFSDFEFEFSPTAPSESAFSFSNLRASHHDEFRLTTLEGAGTGIGSFTAHAFRRPLPVALSLAEIRRQIGETQAFAGKTVLISGASRGFGSVLAQCLGLQGAHMAINYWQSEEEAQRLAAELAAFCSVTLLRGNIGDEGDCRKIATILIQSDKKIDYLVLNASPAIRAVAFADQAPAELLDFMGRSVAAVSVATHAFLPLMREGGTVINISSTYAAAPVAQFAYYIAAKSAQEGLVRALATEYPSLTFINARPPRMLTDQTNTVSPSSEAPASTVTISQRLLRILSALRAPQVRAPGEAPHNLLEIDLNKDGSPHVI